jgi:hypothetical protein
MEKGRGQGYVEGLERMLKGSQLSLKDAMAHFQEMCSKIIPEKDLPEEMILGIRKTYREIQDQLNKIKGIQQLLEGKYRQYYRRNPLREREVVEIGSLAKNYYFKFESILKEGIARGTFREQARPLREYGQIVVIPWFHSAENQGILLRNLESLSKLDYKISAALQSEERRRVVQSESRSLSLFTLSGEANFIDDLQSRMKLREYDIMERYGPDEFRGVLTHLKDISVAEVEKVMRRFMQSGEFSKPKCLLFPIQASRDLRKEILGSTEELLRKLAAGEVKTLLI